jgi:hypothetical protein
MHYERIIFAALIAPLLVGLVGGTLWAFPLGVWLLYLLRRRHPKLWKEFDFRLTVYGPYSPLFSEWLRLRHYEELDDPVIARVARAF